MNVLLALSHISNATRSYRSRVDLEPAGSAEVENKSRILATLGVILVVLVASAGARGLAHQTTVPFLVQGATDVEVVALRASERQISYQAPGVPSTWYADLVRHLEQDHWHSSERSEYGPLTRTYMRTLSFGIVEVREWVFLRLDSFQPQTAHIKLRRVVVFPWWPRLLRTAERWLDAAEEWVQAAAKPVRSSLAPNPTTTISRQQ